MMDMATKGTRITLALAGACALLVTSRILLHATHAIRARTLPTATPGSVVINEVAWMGTGALSTSDEWIELYNATAQPISLEGWRLHTADQGMTLTLHAVIAPHGYYLIERTDDQTVADIPADLAGSFGSGLHNSGEALLLKDASGQVIDTANGSGGAWPAGTASPTYCTMERITPQSEDRAESWKSNSGVIRNGINAQGLPINGTPKAANSHYRPNLSLNKTGPLTALTQSLLTYVLTISNTGSLTATETYLTDTLPGGTVLLGQSSPYTFSRSGQELRWQIGELRPGENHAITLTTWLSACLTEILINQAGLTTPLSETETLDNYAQWETAAGTGPPPVLISALLYNGLQPGDSDEALQLTNMQAISLTLTGWSLCKYAVPLDCTPIPTLQLPAHGQVWLARKASAFHTTFGFTPEATLSPWPVFNNEGDEALLRDASDKLVDTLVYAGGESAIPGWEGSPVQPYDAGRALEGQILARIPNEITGLPQADTDEAADWLQHSAGLGQVRYPGWDLDPLFWPLTVTEPATVIIGIAPDNAIEVITATLLRAQSTIEIEVYALRHPEIVALLVDKARQGVEVTVLLEGSQAGISLSDPRWQQELWACQQIEAAGGQCYFMVQEKEDAIYNRYHYLHGKLIIVDDAWIVIGAQNLTETSLPADDKRNGTYGSRGTVIATNAPTLVGHAVQLFALDCDPEHHRDILRWNTAYADKYGPPLATPITASIDGITSSVRFTAPLVISGTFDFAFFTAPEAVLRRSDGLLGLLGQAGPGDTLAVEQLYEYAAWGSGPNPRLEACIDAARRGAAVRILLNSGAFGEEYIAPTYTQTLAYVNRIAHEERLNLQAAAGDPTHYGIHNKLFLVALSGKGCYAHIGSLNGSEVSSKVNREVVLQIRSDEVCAYLSHMFELDWWLANPLYLPVVMHAYDPPRIPLISEVYYAAGTANREWVEIYNPTGTRFDLSAYKIGDAESRDRYEGMFQFPAGTQLEPYGLIVIAYDGSLVPQATFELYPYAPQIPEMIKYPWGDGDWTLRNDGDQVLLLGPGDEVVDALAWGDAPYGDLMPHPGVEISTHSLQRYPPDQDSDNCATDFRAFPPSPGTILFP